MTKATQKFNKVFMIKTVLKFGLNWRRCWPAYILLRPAVSWPTSINNDSDLI